jgi:mediator of RNA polymerase II transcription subunit 25
VFSSVLATQLSTSYISYRMSVTEREVIWKGEVEWQETVKDRPREQKIAHTVSCTMSSNTENGGAEVVPDNWPKKLIMQLIPKSLVQTLGGQYFMNSKSVLLHPSSSESMETLTNLLSNGFAGCVHFPGAGDVKVLILLYSTGKEAYLGFIPTDQESFVDRLRKVIQQQKKDQGQRQPERPQRQVGDSKEQVFIENGREVRKIQVRMTSGEICWVECV